AQEGTTGHQSGEQGIAVVAAQRSVVERGYEAARTLHERSAGCYVPFVLGSQREGNIGESSGDQSQLVGNRTHGANFVFAILKLLPLTAFHFAPAGENQRTLQRGAIAGARWTTVVKHSDVDGADDG